MKDKDFILSAPENLNYHQEMNNSNSSIETAVKYWISLLPNDSYHAHLNTIRNSKLEWVDIWIKEVVMPWWKNLSFGERALLVLENCEIDWLNPNDDRKPTEEQIAMIYLQEHKEKEGLQPGDKLGDIFKDPFGAEFVLTNYSGQLRFVDEAVSYPYPDDRFTKIVSLKEERVVPETITESREIALLTIARKSLMDVNFTAWYVANESANWQKEQDRKLIQELMAALSNADQYVPWDCGTKHDVKLALTKAESYLNP